MVTLRLVQTWHFSLSNLDQRKVRSEVGARFGQTQTGGVQTRLAGAAVVVVVGDVFEYGSLQAKSSAEHLWIAGV